MNGPVNSAETTGLCLTCELAERRDAALAPVWDSILRTAGWDLVHSYNTSHEGWLVLVARRHITSLADLLHDEAAELGPLVQRVSAALAQVTGCEKTYLAQFAESPDHRHVHIHVVARPKDLGSDLIGPGIFKLLGVDEPQRVTEKRMNELALALRAELTA